MGRIGLLSGGPDRRRASLTQQAQHATLRRLYDALNGHPPPPDLNRRCAPKNEAYNGLRGEATGAQDLRIRMR